ncbi:MAG: sigma-E processing peptidase SpoIIGA [Clostridiales bacterium]
MATYVVYGDLLFLMNLLMDLTLLYGVAHFGNFKTPHWRLILAGLLAAIYGVIAVYPEFQMLNGMVFKLLASIAIVKTGFWSLSRKMFFRALVYFYLMGFVMAGGVMGITWFLQSDGWQGQALPFTSLGLGFAVLLGLLASRWGIAFVKENLRHNQSMEIIEIILDNKAVRVNALLDTGNELLDPITKSPVIVVEFDAVKAILPLNFSDAFLLGGNRDVAEILSNFIEEPIGKRLRLIPFSSIGKRNGLMLGVKPDGIRLPQRKNVVVKNAVICLYRGSLHTKDRCRCIVNPAILDWI